MTGCFDYYAYIGGDSVVADSDHKKWHIDKSAIPKKNDINAIFAASDFYQGYSNNTKMNDMDIHEKLAEPLKEWYCKSFPTDDLGKCLPGGTTFGDAVVCLVNGSPNDFYTLLGAVDDSIVRERIFAGIGDRLNVEYGDVYDMWNSIPAWEVSGPSR